MNSIDLTVAGKFAHHLLELWFAQSGYDSISRQDRNQESRHLEEEEEECRVDHQSRVIIWVEVEFTESVYEIF